MMSRVPVAHAYIPSYSGGRDQEDCSAKPARSYLRKKKKIRIKGGVARGVGPEFKPHYCKKKKKKNDNATMS
jgi:hypothetical protein